MRASPRGSTCHASCIDDMSQAFPGGVAPYVKEGSAVADGRVDSWAHSQMARTVNSCLFYRFVSSDL